MKRLLPVTILAALLLALTSGIAIPTSMTVFVDFDGVLVPCLVDTGAGYTTIRQSEAARMTTLGPTVGGAKLLFPGGSTFTGQIRQIPKVIVPGFHWAPVDLVVVNDWELPVSCLLGGDVLGLQPISIDWKKGELRPLVTPVPMGMTIKGGEE